MLTRFQFIGLPRGDVGSTGIIDRQSAANVDLGPKPNVRHNAGFIAQIIVITRNKIVCLTYGILFYLGKTGHEPIFPSGQLLDASRPDFIRDPSVFGSEQRSHPPDRPDAVRSGRVPVTQARAWGNGQGISNALWFLCISVLSSLPTLKCFICGLTSDNRRSSSHMMTPRRLLEEVERRCRRHAAVELARQLLAHRLVEAARDVIPRHNHVFVISTAHNRPVERALVQIHGPFPQRGIISEPDRLLGRVFWGDIESALWGLQLSVEREIDILDDIRGPGLDRGPGYGPAQSVLHSPIGVDVGVVRNLLGNRKVGLAPETQTEHVAVVEISILPDIVAFEVIRRAQVAPLVLPPGEALDLHLMAIHRNRT